MMPREQVGAATAHRHAYMRRFQGWCVVHAVACHCDNFAIGLQRLDDAQFLLRHDTGEYANRSRAPGKFGIIEMFNLITG
jgi:hypothetical protein